MHSPSPALAATLHALHGEPDVHIVAPALDDLRFAFILALAPNVDPIIGAPGALAGERPDLLAPDIRTSPALSAAVASLIGTNASNGILPTWAKVAPTGWGVAHATALFDAVQRNRCPRRAAAALIGPCDASAALLSQTWDIAHTIQCWGQATPDTPTAWMDALKPKEYNRLLDALCAAPNTADFRLPCLPMLYATDIADTSCPSTPTLLSGTSQCAVGRPAHGYADTHRIHRPAERRARRHRVRPWRAS
jgi:hypothetical protein